MARCRLLRNAGRTRLRISWTNQAGRRQSREGQGSRKEARRMHRLRRRQQSTATASRVTLVVLEISISVCVVLCVFLWNIKRQAQHVLATDRQTEVFIPRTLSSRETGIERNPRLRPYRNNETYPHVVVRKPGSMEASSNSSPGTDLQNQHLVAHPPSPTWDVVDTTSTDEVSPTDISRFSEPNGSRRFLDGKDGMIRRRDAVISLLAATQRTPVLFNLTHSGVLSQESQDRCEAIRLVYVYEFMNVCSVPQANVCALMNEKRQQTQLCEIILSTRVEDAQTQWTM